MIKFGLSLLSTLALTFVFASTGSAETAKAEVKGENATRKPASNACVTDTINNLEASVGACGSGKWMATGDSFRATFCCIENSGGGHGGGGGGGGGTAR